MGDSLPPDDETGPTMKVPARSQDVRDATDVGTSPIAEDAELSARNTEEALRASEERYRILLDNMLEGCQLIAFDWRYLYINDAAARHNGYPQEAMLGRTMMEVWPGIEATAVFALLRRSMEQRVAAFEEILFVFPDGRQRWFAVRSQPAPEGLFALSIDVTERRRAEEQRQTAEERFGQLAENIKEVFWMTDASTGEMLYLSPAYETIWGRSPATIYDARHTWMDAVHADDRARVADAVKAQPAQYDETYRILRPDGSVRWIRDHAFPIRDAAGNVYRIAGTAVDVTEQRQLEDQLRQAQKMESLGRLAGGIAHDFNNLLTVINGLADLMISTLRDRDPLRADLEQIRHAGDRAAALTRQLLALSRQQILKLEVINLNAVVEDMLPMLQRLIGEDVELVFAPSEPLGNVKADPGQVEQVILNLAVNARDAMPDGGRLTIETRDVSLDGTSLAAEGSTRPGPHVLLAVRDTGVGMNEATRERAFEPFFTTKEPGKGTGLGLATVYGIVKQSGGSVGVHSEPGRGSTFKIYMPRVDGVARQPRPATPARSPQGSETILLVEDEQQVRELARRILRSAGYSVLEAGTGGEALLLLERHHGPVHLMVTDVVMPGMNGRELAARLKQVLPQMKVLYASGYTDDAIVRHGVLDDPSRFVSKPYTALELKQKVREVLDS